jgi:antitoxin ParD1/3/4
MNVSLTTRLEKFINRKVKEGKYQTASEVVRDALRAMEERESKQQWLREQIQIGVKDIEEGRVSDLDMNQIKAEARRRFAARKVKKVG